MGITPRFTKKDILTETELGLQRIERGLINVLRLAGETFVKEARDNVNISGAFPKGDYTDRTANLRSSIGYFVLKDGEVLYENLMGTGEGENAARQALADVSDKSGYMLVGVAGMDYAGYVEARGYNVITSQADIAIVNIQEGMRKLVERSRQKGFNIVGDMFTTSTHLIE